VSVSKIRKQDLETKENQPLHPQKVQTHVGSSGLKRSAIPKRGLTTEQPHERYGHRGRTDQAHYQQSASLKKRSWRIATCTPWACTIHSRIEEQNGCIYKERTWHSNRGLVYRWPQKTHPWAAYDEISHVQEKKTQQNTPQSLEPTSGRCDRIIVTHQKRQTITGLCPFILITSQKRIVKISLSPHFT
jgi:hypothetical protein